MTPKALGWTALLAFLCFVGAGYLWWQQQQTAEAPPAPAVVAAPPPVAAAPAPPVEPLIRHPIEPEAAASSATAPPPRPLPPADQADAFVADALVDLLGRKAVLSFLGTDQFVAKLVATVDNLDRPHAAARLWPVNPSPARFQTTTVVDGVQIGAENSKRYAPFVAFVASIDAARAAALYRRLYPLFQQAYEALGYPGKYFNDRVVQVIDHLLQAPEPVGPLRVKLTEVKGPIASATPWLRHEYEDAALEQRSAGQKILIRVGPENARQLKAKLLELRGHLARGGNPR